MRRLIALLLLCGTITSCNPLAAQQISNGPVRMGKGAAIGPVGAKVADITWPRANLWQELLFDNYVDTVGSGAWWYDSSGNRHHVFGTTASKPIKLASEIDFGTQIAYRDMAGTSTVKLSTHRATCYVVVGKINTSAMSETNKQIFLISGSPRLWLALPIDSANRTVIQCAAYNNALYANVGMVKDTKSYVVAFRSFSTTAPTYMGQLMINGASITPTGSATGAQVADAPAGVGMVLGAEGQLLSSTRRAPITMKAFLIYDTIHTTGEMQRISKALADKYGVTFP